MTKADRPSVHNVDLVDVTTTSVGRSTLRTTYETFLHQVRFDGSFRVVITLDPTYGVDASEIAETKAFIDDLPRRYPQVRETVIEQFPRHVGLQAALMTLIARSCTDVAFHLEDDWEITGKIDLNGLINDLFNQDSTEIVLANEHVARGGTFEHPAEVETISGTAVPLFRLAPTSWAAQYMPLCPHLHHRERWAPTVTKALVLGDHERCPDERVRGHIIEEASRTRHNVLWTQEVLARDIGRAWLADRGRRKAITPQPLAPLRHPVTTEGRSTSFTRSFALRAKAEQVIPGMTQTFLKRPENFAEGDYPVYLETGRGASVWDVDANAYVDFICALGAATLGHNHPAVTNTVKERVAKGVLLSLPSPSEITAAELLVSAVPGVEMARFLKTGADACSAAIRLARHLTGRDRILIAGYHGWHDQLGAGGPGVPQAVHDLSTRFALDSQNDDAKFLSAIREQGPAMAAVLLSTPYHRMLSREFLHDLRALCDDHGCLLVLDEIVTGFRLAPGGLGEIHGVQGDILCFSKGLAAGMPIAAIAGPKNTMAELEKLHVSTTFGGELLSIEVLKSVLREYSSTDYYAQIARVGRRFRDGINRLAIHNGLGTVVTGYDPMPCLRFSPNRAAHRQASRTFLAEMARRGVLLRRDVNFISAAHSEDEVDYAIAAAAEALDVVRASIRRPGEERRHA